MGAQATKSVVPLAHAAFVILDRPPLEYADRPDGILGAPEVVPADERGPVSQAQFLDFGADHGTSIKARGTD